MVVTCATGCGSSSSSMHGSAPAWSSNQSRERPRLVVVILIDQLGSWMLERYLPYMAPDGAFKRGISTGAFHQKVSYLHAGTFTAPGHAATYSGAPPAHSGVSANIGWDRDKSRRVGALNDGQHPWLSDPRYFAAPTALKVQTVADVLMEHTERKAKVVSLSYKDYAAVIAGGQKPTLALWYAPFGNPPGFTTSTYYANHLPDWLKSWLAHHTPESYMQEWDPLDVDLLRRVNGPDAGPGEIGFGGLETTFPHDPRKTSQPSMALMATPESNEYLIDLAWEVMEQLEMGDDAIPDLMMISVSAPDVIGHHYGTESWEYFDLLLRLDKVLAIFSAKVQLRTQAAFILTSDHGAAPMPERRLARSKSAGRIDPRQLQIQLETELNRKLGEGNWVATIEPPFVYFSNVVHRGARLDAAVQVSIEVLLSLPSIEAVLDVRDAAKWRNQGSRLRYPVGLSISDKIEADLYLLPKEFYVFDGEAGSHGTNHGTLWSYDRDVPVIMWGAGISAARSTERMDQRRVPASISALLGVDAPAYVQNPPLEGAPPLLRSRKPQGASSLFF